MLNKLLCILIVSITYHHAFGANIEDIVNADKAYTANSIKNITTLYNNNQHSPIISYLYAKTLLHNNNSTATINFINSSPNNYLRSSLIHALLQYDIDNNNFMEFRKYYPLLPTNESTLKEKCNFDLASIATKTIAPPLVNLNWLINNSVPDSCINIPIIKFKQNKLSSDAITTVLYNLIANNKISLFQQVINNLGFDPVNFNNPSNPQNNGDDSSNFLWVYHIIKIAKANPSLALLKVQNTNNDNLTQQFLLNFIAMQFALKFDYGSAAKIFDNSDTTNLSDQELEWKARSYLFLERYQSLIATIKLMPSNLKNKNSWQYWQAKSYQKIGRNETAQKIFKDIPLDYSFYAILAKNELGQNVDYIRRDNTLTLNTEHLNQEVYLTLSLYNTGKVYNRDNLVYIATNYWDYLAEHTHNDESLAAMSKVASEDNYYNLSIYAANHMKHRSLQLSFPILFDPLFQKYSEKFNINKAYAKAITRQESRFMYYATSNVNARGLMQIMPNTAGFINMKLKNKSCNLFDPECSIKMGCWYLAFIYNKFNNYIYTTAAYHAGPARVSNWQYNLHSIDNIRLIELFPIDATRNYVEQVMINYVIYNLNKNDHQINLLKFVNAPSTADNNYDNI